MKKWMWKLIAALVILIIGWLVLSKRKSNDGVALKILNEIKIGLQKKIIVINKRQKKREKKIKLNREGRNAIDKEVDNMSDADIDKYLASHK